MRSLFLMAVMALFTTSVFALEHHQLSLGAGLNFNVVREENDFETGFDDVISANIALAAKEVLKIDEKFYLRTGLWLQEKSAKISVNFMGFDGDLSINTIYASIPLNLQFQVNNKIAVFGGYIADFRINDYCEASGDYDTCSVEGESESVVHNANVGVSLDIGQKLTVELNYQHGLSDVYKDAYKLSTVQAMGFLKF